MGAPGASVFHAAPFAVTVVLDSHGLDTLAAKRARLEELRRRGEWPAIVACVVLAEALTGDHRRDYHEDRLLRACELRLVDELQARAAAALRSRVSARRPPSAVDAIVVAMADDAGGATILSSDPGDLRALAAHTTHEVTITLAASTTGPVRGRTGASLRGGRPVGTAVTCRVEPRRSGRSRGPTQATPSACTTVPTAAYAHSSQCAAADRVRRSHHPCHGLWLFSRDREQSLVSSSVRTSSWPLDAVLQLLRVDDDLVHEARCVWPISGHRSCSLIAGLCDGVGSRPSAFSACSVSHSTSSRARRWYG